MWALNRNAVPLIVSGRPLIRSRLGFVLKSFASSITTPRYRKLNEVYIGNLPASYSDNDLINLLVDKGIHDAQKVTVSTLDTQYKYGCVMFQTNDSAREASTIMKAVSLENKPLHVCLLPVVSRILFSVYDEDQPTTKYLLSSLRHSGIGSTTPVYENNQIVASYLLCKSPMHVPGVLMYLNSLNWSGKKIRFGLIHDRVSRPTIYVYNLDPSVTNESVETAIGGVLGSAGFAGARIKYRSEHRVCASVIFHLEEQMEAALTLLNGQKINGRLVEARQHDDKFFQSGYELYLGNVGTDYTIAEIEQLCNDAAQEPNAVTYVKRGYHVESHEKVGQDLPSCIVYFHSVDAMQKCEAALHNLVWQGKKLIVTQQKNNRYRLFLSRIPTTMPAEDLHRDLQLVLGDRAAVKRVMLKNPSKVTGLVGALVEFYTEEHVRIAFKYLRGKTVGGQKLFISLVDVFEWKKAKAKESAAPSTAETN